MKTLLQILFFCLLIPQISLAQWVLTNGPQDVPIYSFATDGINVYAAADTDGTVATGGCVFLSTNNGEEWLNVSNGLNCGAIYSLAIDDTNIFAGSMEGGVFLSTNMGANWTSVSSGLGNLFVYTLLTAPNGEGGTNLYAGTGGGIFISTNNGANWTSVNTGLMNLGTPSLDYIQNEEDDIILFAGTWSGVFVSTNNGANWTQTTFNNDYVYKLASIGNNIFASAGGLSVPGLFLSTDYGASWSNVGPFFQDLATSGTNLFGLQGGSTVYLTTDNGGNWILVSQGILDTLVQAMGINGLYIFAGGSGGVWRRPLDEMITAVESLSELPINFDLEQNYPNPFNPTTTIKYSVPKLSFVTIKIYDVLGSEVAALVNEENPVGTYELRWDAENLPSGVYFYQLKAGSFVQTKKMLLLK